MTLLLAMTLAACTALNAPPREKIARQLQAMRDAAALEVPDGQRAASLQRAIDGMEADLIELQDAYEGLGADLKALNVRPDATWGEFDARLDRFDERRKTIRARLVRHHLEMIASTTAGEWKSLSRHERDALTAAAR